MNTLPKDDLYDRLLSLESLNANGRTQTPRWKIAGHAWQRMHEMGVRRCDVIAVVNDPEQTYPAGRRSGRRIYQRGELAICAQGDVVITVLPRTLDNYTRAQ